MRRVWARAVKPWPRVRRPRRRARGLRREVPEPRLAEMRAQQRLQLRHAEDAPCLQLLQELVPEALLRVRRGRAQRLQRRGAGLQGRSIGVAGLGERERERESNGRLSLTECPRHTAFSAPPV